MAKALKFPTNTPIGRIVEGDVWTASDKDSTGQLRVIKHGPNAGKPNPQFYIGLAIPKLINGYPNQDWAAFQAFLFQVAASQWSAFFQNGQCVRPDFAWKVRDGDTHVTKEGKPLREKVGCAGHWILSLNSSFAPQIGVETSPGVFSEITDQELVKRGYWGQAGISVSSNESTQTPGIYLNFEKFLLKGKGEVIQTGRSMADTFGGVSTQSALPEGMQALTGADLTGTFSMGGQPGPGGFAQAGMAGFPQGAVAGFPQGAVAGFPQGGGFAPQGGPGGSGGFVPQGATGFPQGQGSFPQGGGFAPNAGGQGPGAFAPGATAFPGSPQAGFPQGQPQGAGAGQFQGAALPAGGNAALAMGGPGGVPLGATGAPSGGAPMAGPGAMQTGPAPVSPSNPPYAGFMGAAPVMLAAANGATYEQFKANGWSDEKMIADGYMAAR